GKALLEVLGDRRGLGHPEASVLERGHARGDRVLLVLAVERLPVGEERHRGREREPLLDERHVGGRTPGAHPERLHVKHEWLVVHRGFSGVAMTVVRIPPRTLKSPSTVIRRGASRAARSSRMRW